MAKNTLRLKVDGSVSLADFRTVVDSFVDLVRVLTAETNPNITIDWVITELSAGSADISTSGQVKDRLTERTIQTVVDTYERIGADAKAGNLTAYSQPVQDSVTRITSVVNGRIPAVHFISDEHRWSVESPVVIAGQKEADRFQLRQFIRTAIRGEVVTLDKKKGLYFTLQDPHTNDNIRCYPPRERLREMREKLFGRFVTVEGLLHRSSDLPTMTEITDIVVHADLDREAWRDAIGSAPRDPHGSTDTPQSAVRKVRDG